MEGITDSALFNMYNNTQSEQTSNIESPTVTHQIKVPRSLLTYNSISKQYQYDIEMWVYIL